MNREYKGIFHLKLLPIIAENLSGCLSWVWYILKGALVTGLSSVHLKILFSFFIERT